MNLIFMFLIYFMMPNLSVRFKGAFWGAVFAGFFYELVKNLFTGFTSQLFDTQFQIYESLALLPLFLLWIFIVWVIILMGAEIAYFIQFPPILDADKINANSRQVNKSMEQLDKIIMDMKNNHQKLEKSISEINKNISRQLGILRDRIESNRELIDYIWRWYPRPYYPYNKPENSQ